MGTIALLSLFSFYTIATEKVEEIALTQLDQKRYELRWKPTDEGNVSYWVAASTSQDFIQHLVATTSETSIEVDGSFPYYGILAEDNGHFSPLSSLISIDEASLHSKDVSAKVRPYLLPNDHPIKSSLDALFSSDRVILNMKKLLKAGFQTAGPRKVTRLIVATHPDFPGYIFKLYLDAQRYHKDTPEHKLWMMRIQGVQLIQKEIDAHGWQGMFKVPKKWIYALPKDPDPSTDFLTKNYILVEEDMDIYPDAKNKKLWKSNQVSQELLSALFTILKNVGLNDCVKPDNIPFSKDGRVAFIDTQSFHESVPYKDFAPFLSEANQKYWKKLIKTAK